MNNAVAPIQGASQGTVIEQSRAVAEVAAAVRVAQDNPRDESRAYADMQRACQSLALASRAFYSVPNRGNGPSVHLARSLARIYRNLDYGVRELARDDDAGTSEIQAFAWDQENNVRSTRTFIVPHVRMVKKQRSALTDVSDIYLNNQNIGARAVRECIFTVLPAEFVEDAQNLCRDTLNNGGGVPLPKRITDMLGAFEAQGVVVDQLEEKIGRPRAKWTAQDVADMGILFGSIQRGEVAKDEAFPAKRVTAAEITGGTTPPIDAAANDHWDAPANADQIVAGDQG